MDELTSTEGIAALCAGGVALLALVVATSLAFRLRGVRAAQRAVLGGGDQRDLVTHAARLEQGFLELRDWVEESAAGIEARMASTEERLDGCVTYRSLVRYDAYGEMSGQQSSSVALLDSRRSGIVLSSILHRENARVYIKHVVEGESTLELSPEEREAIAMALAGRPGAPADA